MPEVWITTSEAVELSGYHPYYLRDLLREGKVSGRKFGNVWQIRKDSLLQYIQEALDSDDKRRGPKD